MKLTEIDKNISFFLYNSFNRKFRNLFLGITQFGTIYFVVLLMILFPYSVNYMLRVILLYIPFILLFKLLFKRNRPYVDYEINQKKEYFIIDNYSFPSGHAYYITAISLFFLKEFIIIALILIILVGYSRIILAMHYFLDVVFGIFMGIISVVILF